MLGLEIALLVLVVVLIILVIFLLQKKSGNGNFDMNSIQNVLYEQEKRIIDDNDRIRKMVQENKDAQTASITNFKETINEQLNDKFTNINKTLNEELLKISNEVNKKVSDNFKVTNDTFDQIKEKITMLNETQKSLESVETSIVSFKEVLDNKKLRGNFGEFQLDSILRDMFGENKELYDIQHKFENGEQVDCLLTLPEPLGKISVDSKFPFDNYKRIYDPEIGETDREAYRKLFKGDVKKHIDDISSKYIINGVTASQAIMFIPSEAVFSEIQGYYRDIIDYSRKKAVWIVSPTTFMALLETIQLTLKDRERSKNVKKILEQLSKLSDEFRRYAERWDALNRKIDQLSSDASDITTTTKKITSKFNQINKESLDKVEEIEFDEEEQ